ncbi:MAG: 5-formyltetrahydrofolate cyclo-ligase [Candidatus Methylacidiphilales bacterium]
MDALKTALRREARAKLRLIPPAARAHAGLCIARTLQTLPLWQNARTILAFQPLPDEPDIRSLWSDGFDPDKTWVFPKIEADQLVLYRVRASLDFAPGSFRILEPLGRPDDGISPASIDLALVPGLAFDRHGGRLGRGQGFYDRLLAHPEWRGVTLGIAFLESEQPAIPREPHDLSLHGILWSDGTLSGGLPTTSS